MRRLSAVLVAVLAATVLAGFAPPASAAPPVTYVEPVNGEVTDPFRPPKNQYGTGNRGLEYATTEGSRARASAAGRVTFAGQVGGALHVVIQHSDGVRTSYSFLRSISVRVGETVPQSSQVGTTGTSFHFGARIGDAYVDPAILLESGPARVHLVPDGEFTEEGASDDRRAMWAVFADRVASVSRTSYAWMKSGAASVGSAVSDAASAVASGAIDLGQLAAGTASVQMRQLAQHLVTVLDAVVNMGQSAGMLGTWAAAFADILQSFLEPCTPPAHSPPSMRQAKDRVVVFVAGLGSHSSGPHARENLSSALKAEQALGYARDNIYDFSYRGGMPPSAYGPSDTTKDLREYARTLRGLLDKIAREKPGAVVDLIAHSQGGLIAREALAIDSATPSQLLPPVEHLVTLGTPHHGADAATAYAWLRWSAGGRALRRVTGKIHTAFDLGGPGVAQLSETSDFIYNLNRRPLRKGVAYTSIAAAEDLIAPAVRGRLAGATNVLVDSGNPFTSHSGLHGSDAARREVQLALADAPATCQSVMDVTARAFTSAGIATVEDGLGQLAAIAANAA